VNYNCDFLQTYLDRALGINNVQVSCAPVGGLYFPGFAEDRGDAELSPSLFSDFSDGVATPKAVDEVGYTYLAALQKRYIPPSCVEAHTEEPWKCLSVAVMAASVQRRMYLVQYATDPSAMGALGLEGPRCATCNNTDHTTCEGRRYIAYWHRAAKATFNSIRQTKPDDGFFLASCIVHTEGINWGGQVSIQGYTSFDGLADWFFYQTGSAGAAPRFLEDDCSNPWGGPCNPTCQTVLSEDGESKGFGGFQTFEQQQAPAPPDCCESLLQTLCGAADNCRACAMGNRVRLQEAGCDRPQIQQWCRPAAR